MSKINLPPVTGGFNLSTINNNFQKIATELNGKVLYRDNPEGEPNQLKNPLDMNGNRIYNLPKPVNENEPLRLKDGQAILDAGVAAKISADNAALSAAAAAQSANSALNTLAEVEVIADEVRVVETYKDQTLAARDEAIAAASASGPFLFAQTRAEAQTLLPLDPGQIVEIAYDEGQPDSPRTRSIVGATGNTLEFVINLTKAYARYTHFNSGYTGSVDSNVHNKLKESVSVKDFGAVGDGVTSDSVAINKALLYAHTVGGLTVTVPDGVYNIDAALHMGRNTTLKLSTGAVLKRMYSGSFLINDLGIDSTVTNYEGNGNIRIEGGTWDGNSRAYYQSFNHLAIGQADNVKVIGCTFLDNIRAHAIDLSASRDVTIRDNKFLGFSRFKHSPDGYGTSTDGLGGTTTNATFSAQNRITGITLLEGEPVMLSNIVGNSVLQPNVWYFAVNVSGSTFSVTSVFGGPAISFPSGGSATLSSWARDYAEAVQLDHNVVGSFSFGALNGTPNLNIKFINNIVGPNPSYIDNTFTSYGAGIGAHGGVNDSFMQGVEITGNHFEGCIYSGVRMYKWNFVRITQNIFKKCLRGIHITPVSQGQQSANNPDGTPSHQGQTGKDHVISNNNFIDVTETCILYVAPRSFAVSEPVFYHEDIIINNNVFNYSGVTNDPTIQARYAKNIIISGNVFKNIYRAVDLGHSVNANVTNNQATDMAREFFFISDGALHNGQGRSSGLNIHNNSARNMGYSGINVGLVEQFSITGNTLIGTSTASPTRYGIVASTTASDGWISGNFVLDGPSPNKPVYGINVTDTCTRVTLGLNDVRAGSASKVVNFSVGQGSAITNTLTVDSTGAGETSAPGLFLKGFSPGEGEIAVPVSESLAMGHYDEATKVFTPTVQVTSNDNWQVYGAGKGVILKTPDGTKDFIITINNAGGLTTVQI